MKNKLMIAAAGSGKTTWIVNRALEQTQGRVLITTFTQANAAEVVRKIIELNRAVPEHITVQTWFSFLLQHGVRPYQGKILSDEIRGLLFMSQQSAQYVSEVDTKKHYFSESLKIYSDKLSKFVVKSNAKNQGAVINRLGRIYTHVFVDEVQDLAGNDLEILLLLFASTAEILLVGDPRQVTYQTHPEKLHSKYRHGAVKQFILDKKVDCEIDETTLNRSHRNNKAICQFSSGLYPNLPASEPCDCDKCRKDPPDHVGVFLVKEADLSEYQKIYRPVVLRQQLPAEGEWTYGLSKGLGFDRILIYPTQLILKYLRDGRLQKVKKGKTVDAFDIPKFYVALTRARYSVAIVCDFKKETYLNGLTKWNTLTNIQMQLF
jgi:DNA helicase-2/ATP-dependent DNA helicase PcrA